MVRTPVIASLSFALLAVLSSTSAAEFEMQRRQDVPLGTGASASSAAASSSPASTADDSSAPTTTAPAPSSTSIFSAISTSTPDPTTTQAKSTQATFTEGSTPVTTESQVPTSTSAVAPPTTSQDTSTVQSSAAASSIVPGTVFQTTVVSVTSATEPLTKTILVTSGTSTFASVITTSAVVAVTTSNVITATSAPSLVPSNNSSGSTGISPSQKSIIIGVVVGVVGAILLGGLAFVGWRVRSRKRRAADDDYDPMTSLPGSATHEKASNVGPDSPFKSTLDQYHNPTGQVNTASNF
ncbi:hypothetical protein MMC19_005004 [Ptychographa xylographoides]|nr:hypothetical protein [Ptychographa xylographoides]